MSVGNFELPEDREDVGSSQGISIPSAPEGVDLPGDLRLGPLKLVRNDVRALERFKKGITSGIDQGSKREGFDEDKNNGNGTLPVFVVWDNNRRSLDLAITKRIEQGLPFDDNSWILHISEIQSVCVADFENLALDIISDPEGNPETLATSIAVLLYEDSVQRASTYANVLLNNCAGREMTAADAEGLVELMRDAFSEDSSEATAKRLATSYKEYLQEVFATVRNRYLEDTHEARERFLIQQTAESALKICELEDKIDRLTNLLASVADKLGVEETPVEEATETDGKDLDK